MYNRNCKKKPIEATAFAKKAHVIITYLSTSSRGGVAQWLGRRISNQGVPGSNPGRCAFRWDLEQDAFTPC